MKKFVLLLWVLFSVHQVFAQGWLQRYGNRSDNTSFQAIAPTQDGGYFQAGYANGSTQLYLVKTDAEGNIIAEKKYSTTKSITNEVHLADAGDGTFVIAYATDTAAGKNNLFVEKINQNCKKIWTQSFGNGFPAIIGDLKRLSDNSFATLITQTSRIGDSAAILKTTQQGVTILQKRIMPLNGISASALTESTDKALYFTTKPNGASDTARLIKASANGDLIWNKTIGTFSTGLSISNIHKITATPDGGFAVLGNYFAKIDTNAVVQWFVNQKFITYATSFVTNSDGSFSVASGYDTQSLAAIKLQLYKIKSTGEILSSKTISSYDGISKGVLNFDLANTLDGGIVITGEEDKSNGSVARTFKIGIDGHLYVNERKIYVYIDKNNNCKFDANELVGFKYATIELTSRTDSSKVRRARADSLGKYQISVDTGSYIINLKGYSNYFTSCTDAVTFTDDINYPLSEDSLYIGLKPTNACPQMEVTVSTPALQRCQTNSYKLHYCNISGNAAQNVYTTVKLDSLLTFQKADKNFTIIGLRLYRFDIGNVDAGQCGDISFTAITACNDSTKVGQALSVEAHIYPDSFCVVPGYTGATLSVEGQCATDSVKFLVKNSGKSPSSSQTNSTNIVVDEIIFLKTSPAPIPAQGTTKYTFPANGKTYRMEVPQEAGNPGFSKAPTVAVEGCGRKPDGSYSIGYVKQFAEDDGDYFIDKDVKILRNDVFGNEMDASPTGYADRHFIKNNNDIEYLVRFRNTTNDTLYNVEVRDTLSDFIDPATIELGASSQPYQMQIFDKKILKFVFSNVAITPDAFNRDKSWGFLKFRVKLKQNIPNGTVINNKAEILFNDGSITVTNKIFHTVGQNFIITATVDKPIEDKNVLKITIAPNPFSEQAQFTIQSKEIQIGTNTFEVYDLTGRLVRREFFEGNKFIFERQTLGNGVYIFRIVGRSSENTGRLVIINGN